MTPFFEARDVAKRFHEGTGAEVRAVDGVSLRVERGGFLLLTGPSGSGKTTLLALLGSLERPTDGVVLIDGADPAACGEAGRSRLRRRLGFAFTGGPMIPSLPLWENVTAGLVPLGMGAAERRAFAAVALERLGLGDKLRAAPEELSTGELGRASLARAMASRPEAILADEPLANLDDATQALVVEALADLHRAGTTFVVATHSVRAFPFATAACRLERGRRVDGGGL